MSAPRILLAAGGTGGHMFPAEALAHALLKRGLAVDLATDERGGGFGDRLPQVKVHRIASGGVAGKGLVARLRNFARLGLGFMQSRSMLRSLKPAVVVGFGGYPSLPGLLAAIVRKIPTVIHEQNAVLGRVNRFLASRVDEVACAFPILGMASPAVSSRAHVVGNPVRPEIRAIFGQPYEPPRPGGPVRVLVTGGSQGARLLSETMPEAVKRLPEDLRLRLEVQQQTRPESMDAARRAYADAMVKAEVAPFFRDMAGRLTAAHLIVGRAGASTVCEIAVAGRPSLLVPLKIAADDHQTYNARLLSDVGAAAVATEDEITVDSLAGALNALLKNPEQLARMAAAASSVATPDAAERLADLVERTAYG
jgi:UDP-N-acetylglucosamine--N-acetylmuramyl-(pentapeptide) pyrophosphoryl-undecaprenol N-acetylglucosamine transferase